MPGKERPIRKIKLAQVITRMILGGAQENTLETCRAFAARPEYEVTLLTGPGLGPEGDLLKTLRAKEDFELVVLPQLRRQIEPVKDLISFFKLWGEFRRGKFDIVHTHSSKAGILGRWAAWLAGVPIRLHTVHGWGFHEYQKASRRRLYIFLERWTARITTKLIAVSDENVRKGLEAGIGKTPLYTTIYSGIPLETLQRPADLANLRSSLGIPSGKLIVGTIGRLSEQKNPLLFVQMAASLVQHRADLFFMMVGDGPLRRDVENEIEKRGLQSAFLLTGLRRDAAGLTRLIDIFVLPSRWEGLPRALLAAMAAGKPVVAARTDGILEVVRPGENGLLVDPNGEKSWAEAVESLLGNPSLRSRLAAEAQKTITEKFSDVKMIADLEKLYHDLALHLFHFD